MKLTKIKGTNQDDIGRDIILFNLMAGTCSKNCSNCYDKSRVSSNMEPSVFTHYLKLVAEVAKDKSTNISPNISTIASRIIEYPYLEEYFNILARNEIYTSIYAAELSEELMHPAINRIFFHITGNIKKEIPIIKRMEEVGKTIDLRVNFLVDVPFDKQTKVIHKFIELMQKDNYILRYSISAKTKNIDSKHSTPTYFDRHKKDFFNMLEQLSGIYPNLKFKAERPFFKCNFTEEELNTVVPKFGVKFYCGMEFTVDPTGVCGLCPPVTLMANPYEKKANNKEEFLDIIKYMRNLTLELEKRPSFDICHECNDLCQGGCLSYKF
jgi:hypothetical protein